MKQPRARFAAAFVLCSLAVVAACDRPTPVAPEESTLEISANPTRIGIREDSLITVFARRGDGTPVNEGTEIFLSTTIGSIPAGVRTNDRGVAEATLQGEGQAGTAQVTARSGAAAAATVDVQIGSLAGSIILTATPEFLPQNGGDIALLAVVQDDLGVALVDANVNFRSDVGTLESRGASVQTNEAGEALDRLTVTRDQLANTAGDFFEVRARTTGIGGGEGTGTLIEDVLEIGIGGAPASMFLQATPTTVPESGGNVSLLVGVRDNLGQPLPGASVNFLTDLGSLSSGGSSVETNAAGEARDTLSLTAGEIASFGGGQFTVRAQVAGVGGSVLEESSTIRIQTGSPRAVFTFANQGGLMVRFTNSSTGQAPLTCIWDFGAGSTPGSLNSCQTTIDVTYNSTGPRTVSLEVSNLIGSDTATATVDPDP